MTTSSSARPGRWRSVLPLTAAALLGLVGCTAPGADGDAAASASSGSSTSPMAEPTGSAGTGSQSALPTASRTPTTSPAPSATATSSGTAGSSTSGGGIAAPGSGAEDLIQAGRTALAAVSGGTLTSIESEAGGAAWEVDIITQDGSEQEMELSADGTEITTGPTLTDQDVEDRDKNRSRLQSAELDYEDAVDKILTVIPEGRITELELDSKQGTTVWEADVLDPADVKYSVQLDAATGTVVENQADSDD